MIQLTSEKIEPEKIIAECLSSAAGAVLLFLGTTRQFTAGRETSFLRYEAYESMASSEMTKLEAEARRRWSLCGCAIVHRLGEVPLGEASVAIVVASPHRSAAFAAGEWLINTLKERVPIWKEEHWADGTCEWIHPDNAPGTVVE